MKLNLSKQEQKVLLLSIVLGTLALWLYSAHLIGPLMRDLSNVRQQVQVERDKLKSLEAAVANETSLRNQKNSLEKTVKSLRGSLPPDEQLPAILERISDLASKSGVKIQTIYPERQIEDKIEAKPPSDKTKSQQITEVYKEIPIHIEALSGFHQFGTFLNLIELEDRPMELESLDILGGRKEPKRHNIKLLLKIYVAVKDEPS